MSDENETQEASAAVESYSAQIECEDCGAAEDEYVVWHRLTFRPKSGDPRHTWVCDDCFAE